MHVLIKEHEEGMVEENDDETYNRGRNMQRKIIEFSNQKSVSPGRQEESKEKLLVPTQFHNKIVVHRLNTDLLDEMMKDNAREFEKENTR